MKRRAIRAGSLVAAVLVAMPAMACLNSASFDIKLMVHKDRRDQALRQVAFLESEFKKDDSAEVTNDLAVARILFGRVDEAIVLLKDLEKRHPGAAATAANLGTAFELSGKDEAALQWIREGIRRDPKEHNGSEWIHVRILEAKLAIRKDPAWLDAHSVLGLSFGEAAQPSNPGLPLDHLGQPHSLENTRFGLAYQLFERTLLVKPKDRVVADLAAGAGDITFLLFLKDTGKTGWRLEARREYERAIVYGHPRRELIERRLAELRRYENPAPAPATKP